MKTQDNSFLAIATLVVLIVVGLGLYLSVHAFGVLVEYVNSEVSSTVLVCATLLICSIIISRALSRQFVSADSATSNKQTVYERVLLAWSEVHRSGRQPEGAEVDELERLLVLRASKSVINCHQRLRELATPLDPSNATPLDPSNATTRAALQQLIAEIRKDLGHGELPWFPSAAVDLLFRQRDQPSEAAAPKSGEFKVVNKR